MRLGVGSLAAPFCDGDCVLERPSKPILSGVLMAGRAVCPVFVLVWQECVRFLEKLAKNVNKPHAKPHRKREPHDPIVNVM